LQHTDTRRGASADSATINIIGAGIAGTWHALLLAQAGHRVALYERDDPALRGSAGYHAGGMLAPWCEAESSEPAVVNLGQRSLALWRERTECATFAGSLVVALPRDRGDLERFASRTSHYERIDSQRLRSLEPSLSDRFDHGLFFPGEGHVEPRAVLPRLHKLLADLGCKIHYSSVVQADDLAGVVIDCRGLAARDAQHDLRAVKGEWIIVATNEVELSRPVRLVHPRWPLYIVPRADHRFMIGATSIESESEGITVRSALELLTAAYAVHPVFAEAQIVEIGAGFRPAYPDNLPRIAIDGRHIGVNGLYRHGFLLAPALAQLTLSYLQRGVIENEVMRCS
jgi:glycine oxidase